MRGKNKHKKYFFEVRIKTFSSLDKRSFKQGLVIQIKDVKDIQADLNFDVILIDVFTTSGSELLERQNSLSGGIDSNDFRVNNEVFDLRVRTRQHEFDNIRICLGHVFQVATENLAFAIVVMDLTSQTIILILTGKLHILQKG